MADTIVVEKYGREAITQMETLIRNAGGSASNPNSSSNPSGSGQAATGLAALGKESVSVKGIFKALGMSVTAAITGFRSLADLAGSRGVGLLMEEFRSGMVGGVDALATSSKAYEDGAKAVEAARNSEKGLLESGKEVWEGTEAAMKDYMARTKTAYLDLGVSLKTLHEFNTVARAASINMGGFSAWQEKLKEGQSDYFDRLGGYAEATEHQTLMMDMLSHSGARAEDLYGEFGKKLRATNDDLLKMGVTYKESREHLIGMTKDENIRMKLMGAATKNERLQIMLETQARFENLKAMGMSTEQAEEASKALAKLAGEDAMTRIEKSAKLQAGLSAMGVKNAAAAAAAYRAGQRATPEMLAELRSAYAEAEEKQAMARGGQGTEALELMYQAISQQTDMGDVPKVMSAKLGEIGAAVTDEQKARMRIQGQDTKNAAAIASAVDRLNTFMQESWIPEVPAMAADIAKTAIATAAAAPVLGTLAVAIDGVNGAMTGNSVIYESLRSMIPGFDNAVDRFGGWVEGLIGDDDESPQEKSAAELKQEISNMTKAITDMAKDMQTQGTWTAHQTSEQIALMMQQKNLLVDQLEGINATTKAVGKTPSGILKGDAVGVPGA